MNTIDYKEQLANLRDALWNRTAALAMALRRSWRNWSTLTVLAALGLFSAGGAQAANFLGPGTYTSIKSGMAAGTYPYACTMGTSCYTYWGGTTGNMVMVPTSTQTWTIALSTTAGNYTIHNDTNNFCVTYSSGGYTVTTAGACPNNTLANQYQILDPGAVAGSIEIIAASNTGTRECVDGSGSTIWDHSNCYNAWPSQYHDWILGGFTAAGPDHYEIVTPASSTGINATAALTVKACADAACSSLYSTAGTVNLTATNVSGQTGTLSLGNPITLSGGSASLTMSDTLAGVTSLSVAVGTAPAAANTMECYNGTTRNATSSCQVTFAATLDHYEIVTPGTSSGINATAAITVKACANATCTVLYTTGSPTITLNTSNVSGQTGTLSSTALTLASGTFALTMSDTLAGVTQIGVAVVGNPAAPNAWQCYNGTTRNTTTSCQVTFAATLDHYEIVTPGTSSGINATAAITVKACANATCTVLYTTGSPTITLNTSNVSGQTGTLSSTALTLASGTFALTMSDTLAGVTQIGVAVAGSPAAPNAWQCYNGTTRNTTTSCQVTFAATLDHYEIVTPSTTTAPGNTAAITVNACANATCTVLVTTGSPTITLNTSNVSGQTGTLSSTALTLASGTLALTMSDTLAGVTQIGVAVVGNPAAPNAWQCYNGTTRNATTSCQVTFAVTLDHYEIVTPAASTAINTTAAITVNACANATCTVLYTTGSPTITLNTTNVSGQTGTLSSTALTLASGTLALTMSDTLAGVTQIGVAVVGNPAAPNAWQCYNGTTRNATTSCQVTFVVAADSFDAVEVSGAIASPLFTKLSSTAFSFDVLAIKSTALSTTFSGPIKIELVDGTGYTGANCSSLTQLQLVNAAYAFTSGTGRNTIAGTTYAAAANNARIRMTSGAVVSCSSDNFSIRPTGFVSLTSSATQTGSSGTPKFKAGTDTFTLTATALAGYNGTPKLDSTKLASGLSYTGALSGSFAAATIATGAATGTFTYSEVGNFNLSVNAIYDDSFTSVDSTKTPAECTADYSNTAVGGKFGCNFYGSPAAGAFGRFIPDHFAISPGATPTEGSTCGFTYLGQDFTTAFTLTAQNAAPANGTTQNYAGAYAQLALTTYANFGFTATSTLNQSATTAPSGNWAIGAASVTAKHFVSRPATPIAPASVTVYAQPTDADLVTTAKTSLGTTQPMRFGILKLDNAYGSELLPLYVTVRALYWKTTGATSAWATNTLDSCTQIAPANIAVSNYSSASLSSANLVKPPATITLADGTGSIPAGMGALRFSVSPATAGTIGSADIAINLGAAGAQDLSCIPVANRQTTAVGPPLPQYTGGAGMIWLRGNWCNGVGTYATDPSARITFGAAKSQFLFQRERN